MRIALDVRWLRRGGTDGIGRVVAALTPELLRANAHEFLLLYHDDSSRRALEASVGREASWQRVPFSLLSPQDFLLLPRLLRGARVDAYYTFNYPTSPLHRGYRTIAMVHDLIAFLHPDGVRPTRRGWRLFHATKIPGRVVLARFDRIYVPSAHTAEDVAREFPAIASVVRVARYGVAPPETITEAEVDRRLAALSLRRGYVLYVGRYDPYKNVASLLAAHRSLPRPVRGEHPLVLVGRVSGEIERDAAEDPHVVATGRLDDLEAVYRGAIVFVYPSLYEGFGLPPLEAMIRGVPVVTTHCASLPEVVGSAAVVTEPTARALTSALSDVLADPQKREDLSRAGAAHAARFDWTTTARRILAELPS